MTDTHRAVQVREVVRLENVAHHPVRLALVEAAAFAARHNTRRILSAVLQKSESLVDLAGCVALLLQDRNNPTHRDGKQRTGGRNFLGHVPTFWFFVWKAR